MDILFILWAGLVLGVSFIATPVKFMAPHLTMPVALEIGKATYHAFNKVEWAICITTVIFLFFRRENLFQWVFAGGLFVLLLVKTFYLLPALDIRADKVIANGIANPGVLHWLYISSDVLQIICALTGALHLRKQEKK